MLWQSKLCKQYPQAISIPKIVECNALGKTPLARIMSMIILGDLVSIELAKLNNVDPTPVEVIENLKKELGGK